MSFPRLRERRQQMGISQQELAEQVGVDQAALSKMEGVAGNPTASNIVKLTRALGCTSDWLLGISDHGPDELPSDLSSIEREIIAMLRTKSVSQQQKLLEVIKLLG